MMTLKQEDIVMLEQVIRRVVREELQNIVKENTGKDAFVDNEEFAAAAAAVFKKHKKVLDALA